MLDQQQGTCLQGYVLAAPRAFDSKSWVPELGKLTSFHGSVAEKSVQHKFSNLTFSRDLVAEKTALKLLGETKLFRQSNQIWNIY